MHRIIVQGVYFDWIQSLQSAPETSALHQERTSCKVQHCLTPAIILVNMTIFVFTCICSQEYRRARSVPKAETGILSQVANWRGVKGGGGRYLGKQHRTRPFSRASAFPRLHCRIQSLDGLECDCKIFRGNRQCCWGAISDVSSKGTARWVGIVQGGEKEWMGLT